MRTAALELRATDNKNVVKIAGILNRLKNVFKRLTDSEYANAVDQLRSDSGMVQATSDQLRKRIEELTEAINDGDVTGYDVALESIRDLTAELAIELKKLNRDAKRNSPRKALTPAPETPATSEITEEPQVSKPTQQYLKHYTTDDVKKNPEGFFSEVRKYMPEGHDVPFGPHRGAPKLKDFKWFQQFSPEDIQIPSGTKSGSQNALFEAVTQLVMRTTNLLDKLDENAVEDLVRSRWQTITANIKQAILDGNLMEYSPPSKPGKGMATVPMGQIDMGVKTAPFEAIPGAIFECYLFMKDLSASTPPTKKLVVRFPKFMRDTASGISVGLKSSPVQRKSTSVPKRNEPIEEVKKSSAVRLELLKSLVDFQKQAGVNRGASKQLTDEFWIKFVQMCHRLGAKPEDLARVINAESAFDPGATNVQGGRIIAKGLNQLIQQTAKYLGMSDSEWLSYEHTPAEDQLEYVEKYFRNVGKATGQDGKWASATQLYVANFAPKYVTQAADPNAILYSSEKNTKEYAQNKGLDRDRKGHITAGDLAKSVQGKLPDHIVQSIEKAKQMTGSLIAKPEAANDNVEGLMQALVANEGLVEGIVRTALHPKLPSSSALVTVSTLSAPFETRMQFAKSAAHVLREIIGAQASIHSDGSKIELECTAEGSQFAVNSAIHALCDCVSEAIRLRLNGQIVRHAVVPAAISNFVKVNHV